MRGRDGFFGHVVGVGRCERDGYLPHDSVSHSN